MIDTERQDLPSASSVPRYAACKGSYLLGLGLPEVQTAEMSAYAESGERIHMWLEDQGFIDLSPWPEELEVAEACLEQRNGLIKKIFRLEPQEIMGSGGYPQAYLQANWINTIVENRIWIYGQKRKKLFSGKGDWIGVRGETGLIIDYKTGRGDVAESPRNRQLRALAVCVWRSRYGKAAGLKRIYVAIVQPLVNRQPLETCYETADLEVSDQELMDLLAEIQKEDAPRTPGKHCTFCPAKFKCPEARAMFKEYAELAKEEPSGEVLAELLNLGYAIKPLIKANESLAKERLKLNPAAIPGWVLGKPGSIRSIEDAFGAYKVLADAALLTRDQFLEKCVSVKIGDLESAVAECNSLKPKVAKDTVNSICADFITVKPKEPSLEKLD